MEPPHKQKAQSLLRKAFSFRNLTCPGYNKSLALQDLAHPSFPSNIKRWLRATILRHKNLALPFHIPSHTVLTTKHRSLAQCVHNWKKWASSLSSPPVTCSCSLFATKFPGTTLINGHIMGDHNNFKGLPSSVMQVLKANSSDTVFPSFNEYMSRTSDSVKKWVHHHHLPASILEEWQQFVEHEWQLHKEHLQNRWDFMKISGFRHVFKDFVVHSEDHAASKLCIFCPMKYFQLHLQTLADPNVFKVHAVSPTSMKLSVMDNFPKQLRERYKWGISPKAQMPSSYIFPKRKKNWTTGRPLITFYRTQLSTLWKALGKLLYDITSKAYPHSWHNATLPAMFKQLRKFMLHNQHSFWDYVFINDDLKGFFTSVPHDRIVDSCYHMLDRYIQFSGSNPNTLEFSVNYKLPAKKNRTIQGRVVQSKCVKTIRFADIIPLIKVCLSSSAFQCLSAIHTQIRGACIGNPCSPPLCNIVVAFHETIWHESYRVVRNSEQFAVRYVDNRLLILSKSTVSRNEWRAITDLGFYQHPVELETVPDDHFLGFRISIAPPSITYIVPTEDWQFRSSWSAGRTEVILSGCESRLHSIFRYTWPRKLLQESVLQLRRAYVSRGFNTSAIDKIIQKVSIAHRVKLSSVSS